MPTASLTPYTDFQRMGRALRPLPKNPVETSNWHLQKRGESFLLSRLQPGSVVDFNAPTGSGRLLVVAKAAKTMGRVAYVSDRVEMREQFATIAASVGVTVDTMTGRSAWNGTEDLDKYDVVIFCETLRHRNPRHLIARRFAVIRL